LEEQILGIETPDHKCHKIKLFADDLKLFLRNTEELDLIYGIVCNFEKISGLEMHRDPTMPGFTFWFSQRVSRLAILDIC
jgi:hypothetical protein